ncbi:hypothetical protein [Lentilactobacillus hilgardii]|uniref:hypothetical protein n=1 Tax=Lentilactobacillus hilgardii TaxID=1588 RepID=UPI0021C259AC|nr:hypothetical protein [Lentilactobacillus hilgardii]MCP9331904.1 hypothetical protein [Lentilactobacillus hilgardii]MCP9348471.1 hypothetical protein [Lentilactobacillus hilgardii]MCP9351319.1 hypothetical protein [Lentilactobacillus hilgardii]
MNWEQIIVVVIISIVILLTIIQAIALIPGNDQPDYQALWQDAEAKRLSQEVEISGYQAQLAYLKSNLKVREKKMSKKVVVEPWFDKLADHLEISIDSRRGIVLLDEFAEEKFGDLYRRHLTELNQNIKFYVRAFKDGYVVRQPRKAFELPSGEYIWNLVIDDDNKTKSYPLTDYKIITKSIPYWLDKDELEYFQKYLVGEVVEEDEDEI